jgi:hypothetical protein
MNEQRDNPEDRWLTELFARDLETPADEGFTDRVMSRIGRRILVRKTVLTAATVTGGIVALGPAYDLALWSSELIGQATAGWSEIDWLPQYRILATAALTAVLAPVVTAILDD